MACNLPRVLVAGDDGDDDDDNTGVVTGCVAVHTPQCSCVRLIAPHGVGHAAG